MRNPIGFGLTAYLTHPAAVDGVAFKVAEDGTTLSMGLNRPPSRSQPVSGCDKTTKRPPGAGKPVDAGSKVQGGIVLYFRIIA